MSSPSSSMSFPTQTGLAAMMGAAVITIAAVLLVFYIILIQIELQSTLTFGSTLDDVALEEGNEDGAEKDNNNNDNNDKSEDNGSIGYEMIKPPTSSVSLSAADGRSNNEPTMSATDLDGVMRTAHLPTVRRVALAAIVAVVAFMTYLLLVRSTANIVLRWVGMLTTLGLLLKSTIHEELRRDRVDRLAALVSMVLALATALHLAVYASQQHAQGDIYEGPARIVGYDSTSYTQEQDDNILRTDLDVAFGSWWGCPNNPDQACTAYVSGALCETETDDDQDNNNRKNQRRRLQPSRKQPAVKRTQSALSTAASRRRYRRLNEVEEAVEEAEEIVEESFGETEEVVEEVEANPCAGGGSAQACNEYLQQQNQELQQENNQLNETNQELKDELEAYEDYVDEEDEEIEEYEEGYYYFDDDYIAADNYWNDLSWEDVWGDYTCSDLFDCDVEGESFDNDEPPGKDDWPFINVYGNCKTCEAYIVDFYSTEHFQSILNYKTTALYYGLAAGISLILTAYLFVKEMNNPSTVSTEKEIELLPTIHGALA